jgi:hypothetical protein
MVRFPLLIVIALPCGADALAQQPPGLRPFLSVTAIHQFDSDLDSGGEFGVDRVTTRLGVLGPLGKGAVGGVTLHYDHLNYNFDAPAAFGSAAPWDDVERVGVSVPLSFRASESWSWSIVPSVDFLREKGADWGDGLSLGAVGSAAWRFTGGRLGFGVGLFHQLEKTRIFPFIAVDYRFAEHWRLTNPTPAGPTGPAGLEVQYAFRSGWEVGAGAARRTYRFRLDDQGIGPDGVGEERSMIGFLHFGRGLGGNARLELYAGAILSGELRVEDSASNELAKTEFDPAPLIGATFSTRL